MVRENTRWKASAEYKGKKVFNGKRFRLWTITRWKAEADTIAKKLRKEKGAYTRVTPSLYYGDWLVWVRYEK